VLRDVPQLNAWTMTENVPRLARPTLNPVDIHGVSHIGAQVMTQLSTIKESSMTDWRAGATLGDTMSCSPAF